MNIPICTSIDACGIFAFAITIFTSQPADSAKIYTANLIHHRFDTQTLVKGLWGPRPTKWGAGK